MKRVLFALSASYLITPIICNPPQPETFLCATMGNSAPKNPTSRWRRDEKSDPRLDFLAEYGRFFRTPDGENYQKAVEKRGTQEGVPLPTEEETNKFWPYPFPGKSRKNREAEYVVAL